MLLSAGKKRCWPLYLKAFLIGFLAVAICIALFIGLSQKINDKGVVVVRMPQKNFNNFPWQERRGLAKVIDSLSRDKAKAIIVVSSVRGWTSQGADNALLKSVRDAGNVYFYSSSWPPLYVYAKGASPLAYPRRVFFTSRKLNDTDYFIGSGIIPPGSLILLFLAVTFIGSILFLKNNPAATYFNKKDISIKLPAQRKNFAFGLYYHSGGKSGRGLFNFMEHENGHYGILMGDVPGIKEDACQCIKKIIQTYSRMPDDFGPREVMVRLNSMLFDDGHKLFANLMLIDIESEKRLIRFSNSGFEPLILFRRQKKEFRLFKEPDSVSLGTRRDILLNESELCLDKSDMLILFNSGIARMKDRQGCQFDIEQLKYIITTNCYLTPSRLTKRIFREAAAMYHPNSHDDKLLMIIEAD